MKKHSFKAIIVILVLALSTSLLSFSALAATDPSGRDYLVCPTGGSWIATGSSSDSTYNYIRKIVYLDTRKAQVLLACKQNNVTDNMVKNAIMGAGVDAALTAAAAQLVKWGILGAGSNGLTMIATFTFIGYALLDQYTISQLKEAGGYSTATGVMAHGVACLNYVTWTPMYGNIITVSFASWTDGTLRGSPYVAGYFNVADFNNMV